MSFASYFDYSGALGGQTAAPSFEFLAELDSATWERLLGYCAMLRLNPGDIVVPAGSADRSLFLVGGGRLESVAADGAVTPVADGAVFGELTFLDGIPELEEVRAVTEAEVFQLSAEALDVMAAREPALARTVLTELGRLLAGRIRELRATRG